MLSTKVIFNRDYYGESLIDLAEDLSYMFDSRFGGSDDIPQDEYGIHKGKFIVTVEWVDTESDED